MSSFESRVPLPDTIKRVIEDIKEITCNHSEEEIYETLRECCMDPNECAQRLLMQDPFQEVKRKRNRRKKSQIKEPAQPSRGSVSQGWGSRGGRVNYEPRHMFDDAGSSRFSGPGKSRTNQDAQQFAAPAKITLKESKQKEVPVTVAPAPSGHMAGNKAPIVSQETNVQYAPTSSTSSVSKGCKPKIKSSEMSSTMQQLENLHLPQEPPVILPEYIRVSRFKKSRIKFGSFGEDFTLPVKKQNSSNKDSMATTEEENYPDDSQYLIHEPETLPSVEAVVSSSLASNYTELNQESLFLHEGLPYSDMPSSSSVSFGFVPVIMGGQFAQNSNSQALGGSQHRNVAVQPAVDAGNYYAQFYSPGAAVNCPISSNPAVGVATRHNGSVAVFPPQATQSPEESGNPSILADFTRSSMAITQQPAPVFSPQARMPISHVPAHYIPHEQCLHPYYVALRGVSNYGGVPLQPRTSLYQAPAPGVATTAGGVRFAVLQNQSETDTGNSPHMEGPSAYWPYGTPSGGFEPASVTAENLIAYEDLGSFQYGENISVQENVGSAERIFLPQAGDGGEHAHYDHRRHDIFLKGS